MGCVLVHLGQMDGVAIEAKAISLTKSKIVDNIYSI
jgi:hypothetical protein